MESYKINATEKWNKPLSEVDQIRLNYMRTQKLPMDCVLIIMEYLDLHMTVYLAEKYNPFFRIRFKIKQAIDTLNNMNEADLIEKIQHGSLNCIIDRSDELMMWGAKFAIEQQPRISICPFDNVFNDKINELYSKKKNILAAIFRDIKIWRKTMKTGNIIDNRRKLLTPEIAYKKLTRLIGLILSITITRL